MIYREDRSATEKYKNEYRDSIFRLAEKLQREALEQRKHYIKDIMNDKERYRKELGNLIGFPFNRCENNAIPKTECEKLSDEGEYSIYRMSIEVLEGHKVTGLFFKYNNDAERPFSVVQHGTLGTPELISGVYGSSFNYNDMLQRVLMHGINVFAPQMLLWSAEEYCIENCRVELDSRLKRAGSSIVAIEAYSIMRIIDYFTSQSYTGSVGMVGLSYGGFFTQIVAALDTRIKAAVSCSFFCGENDYYEQPDIYRENDLRYFGHGEIACLIHPRKLFVEMGRRDELFDYKSSLQEVNRAKEICGENGCDWIEFIDFEGNHEFYKGNEHLDAFAKCLLMEDE